MVGFSDAEHHVISEDEMKQMHQSNTISPSYYLNDKEVPIYSDDIKGVSYDNIVKLLHDPPRDKVSTRTPVKCQENCVFIIDTRAPSMRNPEDWKADDLGVFKNMGTHPTGYYSLEGGDAILQSKNEPESCSRNTVFLKKTYWKHASCSDFQRRAFELNYCDGKEFQKGRYILLQYLFSGKPHAVIGKPHGSSKSQKEYHRTKPGVLNSIKEKVVANSVPSVIYDQVFEEVGGLINVRSVTIWYSP